MAAGGGEVKLAPLCTASAGLEHSGKELSGALVAGCAKI
jgi:hypothetical protein